MLTMFSTLFSGTFASGNEVLDNYGDFCIIDQLCWVVRLTIGAVDGFVSDACATFHVKHFLTSNDFDPSPRLR
jgi:hypothetical protein